jgi:hypothetical protein
VFWVNADANSADLEAQFHGIIRTLKGERETDPLDVMRDQKIDLRQELRKAVERQPAHRPMLFVFDNIPETSAGEPASSISRLCPVIGVATVLATSRQNVLEHGVRPLPVDELPRSASVILVRHGLSRSNALRSEQWERLAELTGDLPLMVDLVNRLLATNALVAPKLLARLEVASMTEDMDSACEAVRGEVAADALRGVTEALSISIDKLGPRTRKAAFLLAQLPPRPIPERVVERFDEIGIRERAALNTRHFVTGGGPGIFGEMHCVMADFLRVRSREDSTELFESACRAVAAATAEVQREPGQDSLFDGCWEHKAFLVQRWLSRAPGRQSRPPLLPVLHVTDARSCEEILTVDVIQPWTYVTGEAYVHCWYGSVVYRRETIPTRPCFRWFSHLPQPCFGRAHGSR